MWNQNIIKKILDLLYTFPSCLCLSMLKFEVYLSIIQLSISLWPALPCSPHPHLYVDILNHSSSDPVCR